MLQGLKLRTITTGKPCDVPSKVNKTNALDAMHVYPNPVADRLYIQLKSGIKPAEIAGLELFNEAGMRVYQSAGFQPSINVSGLSKGIYWLKLKHNGSELVNKVLIK